MINNQALKLDKLLLEVEGPKKYVEREGNGNSGTKWNYTEGWEW